MASRRYDAVEVTVASARDLKNVNWRHGDLKPYVVAWIDPASKCSTGVSVDGDYEPVWDEKIVVPLPPNATPEEAVLCLDVVHAGDAEDVKPLVGSARLHLRDVVEEVGAGGTAAFSLKLKRPSGRPQGKLEVEIALKDPVHRYAPSPAAAAYGYGQPASRGGYYSGGEGYGYGQPYAPQAAAATAGYPYAAPPAAAAEYSYGAGGATAYGGGGEGKATSKFGMGTGLAVGAAAGVVGGLALAEGIDYVEDKIAEDAAERVEDDLADDGSFGGDDDDF